MKNLTANSEKKILTMVKLPVLQLGEQPENYISQISSWVARNWRKQVLVFDCKTVIKMVTVLKNEQRVDITEQRFGQDININTPNEYIKLVKKDVSAGVSFYMLTSYTIKLTAKIRNNYLFSEQINRPEEICVAQIGEQKAEIMEFEAVSTQKASDFFKVLASWSKENSRKKFLLFTVYQTRWFVDLLTTQGLARRYEDTRVGGKLTILFEDAKRIEMRRMDMEGNLGIYFLDNITNEANRTLYQAPMEIKEWKDVAFFRKE